MSLKYFYILIFLVLTAILQSCVKDPLDIPSVKGPTELKLIVSLPGYTQAPQTYALEAIHENHVETLDLMVFEDKWDWIYDEWGNPWYQEHLGEILLYHRPISMSQVNHLNALGDRLEISINLEENESYSARLFMLANCRDYMPPITEGMKRQDLIDHLEFSMPAGNKWKANNGSDYEPFPMWGQTEFIQIHPNQNLHSLGLVRAMAKINIGVNYVNQSNVYTAQGLDDFQLEKVHLYNTSTKGRIVPYDGRYYQTSYWENNQNYYYNYIHQASILEDEPLHRGPIEYECTDGKEIAETIYVMEMDSIRKGYEDEGPCIVLEGLYKGEKSFYRFNFIYDISGSNSNYQPFQILRNTRYRINLTGVYRPGYSTLQEAFSSAASNDILSYTIDSDEDNPYMATDGAYYMTFDKVLFEQGEEATSNNIVKIFTNADGGWTATTSESWITINGTGTGNKDQLNELSFDVQASSGWRSGIITLKAGNIIKEIKINQGKSYVIPANYGTHNNAPLEVFMEDMPLGYNFYEYTNTYYNFISHNYRVLPFTKRPDILPNSCAALNVGGNSDWRMPNAQELLLMFDYAIDNEMAELLDYTPNRYNNGYIAYMSKYYLSSSSVVNPLWTTEYSTQYLQNAGSRIFTYYYHTEDINTYPLQIKSQELNKSTRIEDSWNSTNTGTPYTQYRVRCVRQGEGEKAFVIPATSENELDADLYVMEFDLFNSGNTLPLSSTSIYVIFNRQDNDLNGTEPTPDPPRPFSCASLNTEGYAGYNDWRLPSMHELTTIFDTWDSSELLTQHNFWDFYNAYQYDYSYSYYATSDPADNGVYYVKCVYWYGNRGYYEVTEQYLNQIFISRCVRGNEAN